PRYESSEIDRFRTLDIERLELVAAEGHELAALVFVAFDNLVPLDFLASLRVMGPERDRREGPDLLHWFWRVRAACLLRSPANVPLRFLIILFCLISRLRSRFRPRHPRPD